MASERDHSPDFTRHDCQRPKRAVPWFARQPARGDDTFPSILPMAVVRLGDELISFVPAELTFAAGSRVAGQVSDQYAAGPNGARLHAIVAGLTNGYIQYIATEEEYFYQGYEGASTLFGSHSPWPAAAAVQRADAAAVRNVRARPAAAPRSRARALSGSPALGGVARAERKNACVPRGRTSVFSTVPDRITGGWPRRRGDRCIRQLSRKKADMTGKSPTYGTRRPFGYGRCQRKDKQTWRHEAIGAT
jgi:hypothetical protein